MSTSETLLLLNKETATGAAVQWPGGKGTFHLVCGGYNGATCTLQRLGPDGATWTAVGASTTVTADALVNIELGEGPIRVVISAAVPSAGVYASVSGIK